MRQRYLALFSMFASLPAMALTFQTRMENVAWKVEGDVFECRLVQPVEGFGSGEFVRRAGEAATFQLRSSANALGAGPATLLAAAAPWQPGRADIDLGSVRLGRTGVLFSSSQGQASRLINGLLDGRNAVVRNRTGEGGRTMEVRVLPVSFAKAYTDYQVCASRLLPMNYDQIRLTQVGFPARDGTDLDAAAKARLEVLVDYMKADPTVNRIELDGHSDNSGNRLTNRELSRRRALAVADYFKAHGFTDAQITVRFHGERYPLVRNDSAANRARNRRVSIQLERGAPLEAPAPASEAAAPAAGQAPATPSAPAAAATPASGAAAPVPTPAKP